MTARGKVLVLGCDTGAFLGVVRSLGRAGWQVHTAGCPPTRPAGQSRHIAADHPLPPFAGTGEAWCEALAALVAREGFALVVPTSDSTLAQLAACRARLGEERVALPPAAALALFSDKAATRALAERLGIAVAPGTLAAPGSDPAALAARFGWPLIVKSPRSYHLGAEVQKTPVALCEDEAALARALAGETGEAPLLVESFVPGFCRGVSVLAVAGEVRQAFQHRRLRQEHRTGPSSWRRSEPLDPALREAAARLVRETGFSGVAMFEFRFTDDGARWVLLEVNPRFWGSLQLAMAAGADYPATLCAWLVEGRPPPPREAFAAGVETRSEWGEYDNISERWDHAASWRERAAALAALARYLVALARGRGFDCHDRADPAPLRAVRAEIVGRLAARMTGRVGR